MSQNAAPVPLSFDTFDAYLDWEEQQPERYELHDGVVVAMAGASEDHNRIADNVTFLLRSHYGLRGRCTPFRAEMKLRVDVLSSRYPDVFVVCSEERTNRRYHEDARLVVEVISPDYAAKDLVSAAPQYIRLPSLEQYIVIDSRKLAAWSHVRSPDGRFVLVTAELERIEIPCENLALSFEDIYAGTTLDTATMTPNEAETSSRAD
jgi:Uma2 family endonuclease